MKPPCTIIVQYILPALRMEIARRLVEKYGLKKSVAAKKMGITPSAISQYRSGVRGNSATVRLEASPRVMELVDELAGDISKGSKAVDVLLLKLCRACAAVRSEGLICDLHKEVVLGLGEIQSCSCSMGINL